MPRVQARRIRKSNRRTTLIFRAKEFLLCSLVQVDTSKKGAPLKANLNTWQLNRTTKEKNKMKYILTLNGKFVGDYDTREDADKAAGKIAGQNSDKNFWKYGFTIFERPESFEIDHEGENKK